MPGHKKQHYIPICYLKAWYDPLCSEDPSPYVWIFSANGENVRNKSPINIFYENNFYTIKRADGKRDLTLENGLNELETQFSLLRENKLKQHLNLTPDEHILLCAFIAAMHARTKVHIKHEQGQWKETLDMMDKMREWAKTASSEQKEIMARPPRTKKQRRRSLSYADVKELANNPIQHSLMPLIDIETPLLCALDLAILETNEQPGFITSDNPCVWEDPEAYKRPPFWRAPGLMYESIVIIFPISPQQAIVLNRKGYNGYINVNEKTVDEINRTIRFHAGSYFIVNSNFKKDIWFDPGQEPENSWRVLDNINL